MKSKKITIAIFGIILVIIATILSIVNYNILNRKYKNAVVVEHSINENINGGTISLIVKGFDLIDGAALKVLAPEYKELVLNPDGSELKSEQIRVLLIDLDLINTTAENQSMLLAPIYAQSLNWANGIPMDLFEMLNKGKGNPMGVPLAPNETLKVAVPYILYSSQFKKTDWANIENRKYDLSLSLYPIKHIIHLQ